MPHPTTVAAPPTCAVVVCTYAFDRLDDVTACLDAVLRQEHQPEQIVVVVDHNEPLRSLLARRRDITVVANSGVRGLSDARNTGVAAADTDVIVFLDDDAVPEPGWLTELLRPFEQLTVAAVGGHITPAWPADRPWWFPHHLDWTIGCSIPTLPPGGGPIRNVFGASAAFRRAALIDAGGFAAELGRLGENAAGCEETDVCIRLRQRRPSSTIVYAPLSTVRHRVTDERATVRYVLRRCLAEGRSKALLARRVGGDAVGDERTYALTIGRQVLRDVASGVRHPRRIGRAAVLVAGLGAAAGSYTIERVRSSIARTRT